MIPTAIAFAVFFALIAAFYARIYLLSSKRALPMGSFGGPVNPDTTLAKNVWDDVCVELASYPRNNMLIALAVVVLEIAMTFTSAVAAFYLVPVIAIAAMVVLQARYNLKASAVARARRGLDKRQHVLFANDDEDAATPSMQVSQLDDPEDTPSVGDRDGAK